MTDSIRVTRSAQHRTFALPGAWLRMAMVVLSCFAVLIALPGWLRSLENGPAFLYLSHPPDASLVFVAQTSVAGREPAHHQALADFLAKRYRVSSEALERFIRLAYSAGQMTKLDPLLILAVMAVESNFNPIAESGMGAKGLMQVIPQFHQDKLKSPHGGELNVLDPETNILLGAKVLREYASRTGGDYAAALGLYVGAGPVPGSPYANKVLTERERLEEFLREALHRSEPTTMPARGRT